MLASGLLRWSKTLDCSWIPAKDNSRSYMGSAWNQELCLHLDPCFYLLGFKLHGFIKQLQAVTDELFTNDKRITHDSGRWMDIHVPHSLADHHPHILHRQAAGQNRLKGEKKNSLAQKLEGQENGRVHVDTWMSVHVAEVTASSTEASTRSNSAWLMQAALRNSSLLDLKRFLI